jgi:hypothetical protein
MYVDNIYNYFCDFRRPVNHATMKIKITIENGWSLKLHQMRQVDASPMHLSSIASTKPTKNKSYPAYKWAARRVRSE